MTTTVNPPADHGAVNNVDGAAAVEDNLAAGAKSNGPLMVHVAIKPPPAVVATAADANAAKLPRQTAASMMMKTNVPGKKTAQPGSKNNKRKSEAPPEEEEATLGVAGPTTFTMGTESYNNNDTAFIFPPLGMPMIPRIPSIIPVVPTVAGSTTISTIPALRRANDAEFVRIVASEFKRRGYKLAMRLETDLSQDEADKDDDEEGGEEDRKVASKKKPRTSSMSSSNPTSSQGGRKQPTPLSVPTFQFYPSTVCVSNKNAETWNIMFGRMKSYYDENSGSLPVADIALYLHATSNKTGSAATGTTTTVPVYEPAGLTDDSNLICLAATANAGDKQKTVNTASLPDDGLDVALYKWTKAQITLWKRMKKDSRHNLSLDRIAMLYSLDFERAEAMSRDVRTRVLLAEPAPTLVSGGATKTSVNLDDDDDDDDDDIKGLKLTNPGRNALKWHTKFEMLRQYRELHGDTNVPRSYDDKLSKWCAVQRMRCKELMQGDKSAMTNAQYQALQGVDFNFHDNRKKYDRRVIDQKWEDKFAELVAYKKIYGNCDVAVRKGFENYKTLANWAGLMRRKYKARQTGTKAGRTTGITDEQIKKLAFMGFSFSLQDDFDTRFKHLLDFKKEFGHTRVPVFYTGHNNLGRWAKRMRDGIRKNEPWMDEMRSSRLKGIDFDCSVRHVFGKTNGKSEDGSNDDPGMEWKDGTSEGGGLMAQQMGANNFVAPSLPAHQLFYGYPPMSQI